MARLSLSAKRLRELGVSDEDIRVIQKEGVSLPPERESSDERANKWHNRAGYDERFGTGEWFQSEWEREVWYLRYAQEQVGEIRDLRRQVKFSLVVNGVHICDYYADFTYYEPDTQGQWCYVVEDAKGKPTSDYIKKRKLMLGCLGITIRETHNEGRKDNGS